MRVVIYFMGYMCVCVHGMSKPVSELFEYMNSLTH